MYALDRILAGGVQVAVLGTGDRDYEDGLRYFQDKYPGTMAARIEFGILRCRSACMPPPICSLMPRSLSPAAGRRSLPCAMAPCPSCARPVA